MPKQTKNYPDYTTLPVTKVAEEAVVYALPEHEVRQQATVDAIMLMYSTLDEEGKREVVEQVTAPQLTVRDYARRICTPEEYDELEREGFLDNPQPVHEPETEEELLAEVIDFHRSGYLSAEETSEFFKSLRAL